MPQRFAGIDIPDSRDTRLIQQKLLQRTSRRSQCCSKELRREFPRQRVHAKPLAVANTVRLTPNRASVQSVVPSAKPSTPVANSNATSKCTPSSPRFARSSNSFPLENHIKWPSNRKCISISPRSSSKNRYFPRLQTSLTCRRWHSVASSAGDCGLWRSRETHARNECAAPRTNGRSVLAMASTSGSSGMKREVPQPPGFSVNVCFLTLASAASEKGP